MDKLKHQKQSPELVRIIDCAILPSLQEKKSLGKKSSKKLNAFFTAFFFFFCNGAAKLHQLHRWAYPL